MKKFVGIVVAMSVVALALVVTGCCGKGLTKTEYTIATGSRSGVYFPIGETLATILREKFPSAQLNIMETAGSVENIQLLTSGKVDLALVQNDIAYYAAQGEAMFDGNKITSMRGIATLFPEVVQLVVATESGITSLKDFEGRKIAVGNRDSGTYYNAHQILTLAGVWNSIDHQFIGVREAIKEIQEGNIDGFVFTSGLPNPSIVELGRKLEISIVPIDPELVQQLVNAYPFYFPSVIPPNQYPGQVEDIPAVEINAILVSGPSFDENDQYLFTKYIFGEPNDLGQSHPRLSKMTRASLRQQMPVNLAPGAYKAYTEIP